MPIIGLMLSVGLWLASLYQLEIIDIHLIHDEFLFQMPFFLGGDINIWLARDLFYLANAISLVLSSYSGAVFNVKRMELRMKNVKPTN